MHFCTAIFAAFAMSLTSWARPGSRTPRPRLGNLRRKPAAISQILAQVHLAVGSNPGMRFAEGCCHNQIKPQSDAGGSVLAFRLHAPERGERGSTGWGNLNENVFGTAHAYNNICRIGDAPPVIVADAVQNGGTCIGDAVAGTLDDFHGRVGVGKPSVHLCLEWVEDKKGEQRCDKFLEHGWVLFGLGLISVMRSVQSPCRLCAAGHPVARLDLFAQRVSPGSPFLF